jgi:hypothetical protein
MEEERGVYLYLSSKTLSCTNPLDTVPSRYVELVHAKPPYIAESECGDKFQSGDISLPRASEGDNHRHWRYAMVEIGEAVICRAVVDLREPTSSHLMKFVPLVLSCISAWGHVVLATQGLSVALFVLQAAARLKILQIDRHIYGAREEHFGFMAESFRQRCGDGGE